MAKYYGPIGFAKTVETAPGVWEEQIVEHPYYGDVLRNSGKWTPTEHLTDDIEIDNRISIIGDAYAYNTFHAMRYIVWKDIAWKIKSVDVLYPRLILTIGGVYNGERPNSV